MLPSTFDELHGPEFVRLVPSANSDLDVFVNLGEDVPTVT